MWARPHRRVLQCGSPGVRCRFPRRPCTRWPPCSALETPGPSPAPLALALSTCSGLAGGTHTACRPPRSQKTTLCGNARERNTHSSDQATAACAETTHWQRSGRVLNGQGNIPLLRQDLAPTQALFLVLLLKGVALFLGLLLKATTRTPVHAPAVRTWIPRHSTPPQSTTHS